MTRADTSRQRKGERGDESLPHGGDAPAAGEPSPARRLLGPSRRERRSAGGVVSDPRGARPRDDRTSVSLLDAWSSLRDAMVLASPGADGSRPLILAVNHSFRSLFGLASGEADGLDLVPFLAPDDEAAFFSDLRDMVERGGESMTALTVLQERSQEGDPKLVEWELAPIRDAQGRVRSLIGVLGDARSTTVSRSIQAGMMIDAPSEASSKMQFLRRVERSLERAHRAPSYGFAVIGLDIEEHADNGADYGSTVRSRVGAAVGEAILEAFAWRVQTHLRPDDLVARIDRRRLAVLLDGFSPDGGVGVVIDRIDEIAETPFSLGGERVWVPAVRAAGFVYNGDHAPRSAREVLAGLE